MAKDGFLYAVCTSRAKGSFISSLSTGSVNMRARRINDYA